MSKIEIIADEHTSNYQALLAVFSFVVGNCSKGRSAGYQHKQTLYVGEGFFDVIETPVDNNNLTCDSQFHVFKNID